MRADRLLSIVLLLQNHGKLTSKELARRLEVSERTIMRDMDALSAAGIPVYADRGSNGGWMLAEGYRTTLTGMKATELLSLLLIPSSLLDDLGLREEGDSALRKLLASTTAEQRRDAEFARERLHIDGAGWHESTKDSSPCLPLLQEAVWEERAVRVEYEREDGVVTRTLQPLGLVAKRNVWYLVAETGDAALRTYRLSRLRHAELLDETFTRPAGFDLASYWAQSTSQFTASLPRYPARIRLRDDVLARLSQDRYVRVGPVRAAGGGWSEAEVEFHTLESAAETILRFGPRMVAIAPAELRAAVIAEAKALLAQYGEEQA
ncbi:YafY family transcriptional regulator [Paenibacillus dendritiformis]|uniref:helix-turn-helix transcriptional regulator n=1 Tax=Paenibacillus dendritiformis TaxID=130049 RepID=UPI00105A37F2|nr:YafY family protein [Paenibacillus dendritiformis]TDL48191.1 YafY family transcriptional regulator [Paenibacillus dendritiformis]